MDRVWHGWVSRYAFVFSGILFTSLLAVPGTRKTTPSRATRFHWIIASGGLARIEATPHPPGLLRQAFDNDRTWLIVGPNPSRFLNTWRCRRVRGFRSYSVMEKSLGRPSGIWGVLYDPESWPYTPMAERLAVPRYAALAASLAHSRGLQLIVTPATDLVHSILPQNHRRTFGDAVRELVRLKLAKQTAPAADVYEIQSQGAEPHKKFFVWYVTQEARQVRAANPRAIILAGLSTNPHGLRVTAREVYEEVLATRRLVQGYWLNVPSGGRGCPTCGEAQPQVAVGLLRKLRDNGLL